MKEKTLYKIQAVVIALILIFQVFIPILSMADDKTSAIKVDKKKEGNTVTLTITDTQAKVNNVRIIYGEKITDVNEFIDSNRNIIANKGEALKFTSTSEAENNYVCTTSFEIKADCYDYTIFILDANKNSFIYNYTITPPSQNGMTMSVTKSEANPRVLTIKVTSEENNITKLKIAKVSSKDETVDFKNNGTIIKDNLNSKDVTETYTVDQDGIYKVYAENDKNSSYIYTVIVSSEKNPITIEYEQNETQKNELKIKVSDTVANITSVKIAKYEVDKETNWENATEIYSNNSESNLENLTYTIPESGKYSIKVTDSAGMSFTRTTSRLYINDENKPEIKVSINKSNPKVVNIVATDNMSKVKELYVSENENLSTIEDIQAKATKLSITSSNKVEVAYEVKNAETLYIYAISEDGQAFMLEAKISEIEVIDDNNSEEQKPDNDQPEEQKPDNNQPEEQEPDNDQPEEQKPDNNQPEEQEPDNNQPENQNPNNNNQELIKPEKPEEQEPSNNNQELIKPEKPEEQEPEYSYTIEDNDDDYSYDNETNSNYNQNDDEVEEYEDSTVSNNPLPQTGIKNGIVTVMMILIVNAVIALRKYSKIR